MAVQSESELKQILYEAYGGFADKRIRKIDSGNLFIIDDRGPGDRDARKALFLWFCQMFAEVDHKDAVKVTLGGDVPNSAAVQKWLAQNGAQETNFGVQFLVKRGEEKKLAELASRFRDIVAPGCRYSVPSYKYVCPRTAASLDHLSHILEKAWG